MKKKLLLLLIMSYSIMTSYSQKKDSDGDGIADTDEVDFSNQFSNISPIFFNRFIADIPSISIVPYGEVRIGVEYKYTNETTLTLKTIEKTGTAQENTTKETKYNSNSVKKEFEANLKAGVKSSTTGPSYSYEANVSASFKLDAESGIKFSEEKIDKFKKEYENLKEQVNESKVKLEESAGYIKTKFVAFNPHPYHTIKLKNLRYKIYIFDIKTGKVDKIPFMNDENLFQNTELILRPTQSDDIYIEISKINTKKILDLLTNEQSIIFDIKDYDFTILNPNSDSDLIKYSQIRTALKLKTIPIRIIDSTRDVTYFVSKKDSLNQPLTIKKALQILNPDSTTFNIEYSPTDDKFKIIKLNEITSSLDMSDLNNLTKDKLEAGRWFTFYSGRNYSGTFNSKLDCDDCSVTFVYFTARDIQEEKNNKIDTLDKIEALSISSSNIEEKYDTRIKIKPGTILHFIVKSEVQTWRQNWESISRVFICAKENAVQTYDKTDLSINYKKGSGLEVWNFYKTTPYHGDFGLYLGLNSRNYNFGDFTINNIKYTPDNQIAFDINIDPKIAVEEPILFIGSTLRKLNMVIYKLLVGNSDITSSKNCGECRIYIAGSVTDNKCQEINQYTQSLGQAISTDFVGDRKTTINIYQIKKN